MNSIIALRYLRRVHRLHVGLVLTWSVLAANAVSATEEVGYGGAKPPQAEACFTGRPPVIDGTWSPGEWDQAPPITFAATPSTGDATATGEARFLWNNEGAFIGFRAIDSTPVYGGTKPGESLHREDVFEVFFDQVGDHHQFYELQIAPNGQLYLRNHLLTAPPRLTAEERLTQEFVERELWRYDVPIPAGLKSASVYDPKTHLWTAEIFLPATFANRRLDPSRMTAVRWRINLVRHDWDRPLDDPARHGTFMYWAPVLPGHPHLSPTAMGWLTFTRS